MPVPLLRAAEKPTHPEDASEPIRCALVEKPTHQNEVLRYVLVVTAWLAVATLIAGALYYTVFRAGWR